MSDIIANVEPIIASLGDLPALPSIVAEVVEITHNPSATMAQVSACIQRDPALAAKILSVSNSPFYGLKQYVGTLKLALVVLGVREIRSIVLGISVYETLQGAPSQDHEMLRLWNHSVLVAGLCRKLGAARSLGLQGEDFMAGLLHDIGKLVLVRQLGEPYSELYSQAGGASGPLCTTELSSLGFTHAHAAAAVAAYWNLPRNLVDAFWLHHPTPDQSLASAVDPRLAALVRVCNMAGHDDFQQPDQTKCASCTDEEAWAILDPKKTIEGVERRHEMLSGFIADLKSHPQLHF